MVLPVCALAARKDRVEFNGLEHVEAAEDAQRKAEVADAVHHEGLDRGGIGAFTRVPEADEQIGHEPHAFPAKEHLQEIVGGDQHEHGEGEEREIGEEARLMLVMAHVAKGIDMHEGRDGVHHHKHDGGQRIDAQRPIGCKCAGIHPAQNFDFRVMALMEEAEEHDPRQNG